MALLEVTALSKSFHGVRAVTSAAFTVDNGAIAALIGPSYNFV